MSTLAVDQITDSAGANIFPTQMIMPIGTVFMVWDNLTDVSIDNSLGNFIKLTAGEDGAGQFNEGLLTNETVSGSAPLVEATAEIAVGPLTGETVHLINTEEAVIRARQTSGALQFDEIQRITGGVGGNATSNLNPISRSHSASGPFSIDNAGGVEPATSSTSGAGFSFDTNNISGYRSGNETRAKNVSATAYMRIA